MNARELRARRAELLDQARALNETAETEDRSFSEDETSQYDQLIADAAALEVRINRLEATGTSTNMYPAIHRAALALAAANVDQRNMIVLTDGVSWNRLPMNTAPLLSWKLPIVY